MDTQPQPRARWLLNIALAVSLALNLLFVGMFAGAAYRHAGKRGPSGPELSAYAAPYMRALPREDRRTLWRMARKEGSAVGRDARRVMYQRILAALRADPFDTASVAAVLAEQQLAVQGMQDAAQTAWLELVTQMSPQARRQYADAVEEEIKHGPRRSRDKRKQE